MLNVFVFTKGFPEISMACPLIEEHQRSVVLTLNDWMDEKFTILL